MRLNKQTETIKNRPKVGQSGLMMFAILRRWAESGTSTAEVGAAPQEEDFSGRSRGNKITSRMECEFVRSIVRRSMPMPSPPVGGMP